ncbi:MAG: ornithine cyclodeaminase family protein [Planctomycetes bacterium]|nr:ornithine cyclodeaminase family protein [Planctomycetota bacterium]
MPVLYLTENDVRQVLTMEIAIAGVEAGLRKMALEEAFNVPRTRCQTDHTTLNVLSAAAKTVGVIGYKAYTTTKSSVRFHITLYDGKTGEMIALMQANLLGQMRTGAASAVSTKFLSRPESSTVGLFGTGKQARTQLLGMTKVRTIQQAFVYSPNEEHRKTFAAEMSETCSIEVVPVATPAEAARNLDIVITATSARDPSLRGEWVSPGQHLNIIGSNFLSKREIDVEVIKKANFVCIDSKDQGKLEAGDFVEALDQRIIEWYDVQELGRVVAKRIAGRESPQDVTLFKSLGIGLEDIVVGAAVLEKAKQANLGTWLDL